jgi:PASTA domain
MPLSVFSVTVPETKVLADRDTRRAAFSIDVKNESAAAERVVVAMRSDGAAGTGVLPAQPAWFGDVQQRPLAAGLSQQFAVNVSVPESVAPGTYGFVPIAYSADRDPEETAAAGPTMSLVLPAPLPPQPPWWRRWWPWWLVAAVAVLALVVAAVVVVRALTDDSVPVPPVAGQPAPQARQRLQALGLRVVERTQPSERTVDTALSTEPPEGTKVKPGTEVTLVVALADRRVTVPSDLVGLPQELAQQRLADLGLQVTVQQQGLFIPPFTVVAIDPPGGTKVLPGTLVTLFVQGSFIEFRQPSRAR